MTLFLLRLLDFVSYLLDLYIFIILASVIFSWLIAFNVINPHNQFVSMVWRALDAMTEPVLRPIRRMLPEMGGLDLSPLVLLLGIYFIQRVLIPTLQDAARTLA
ncbi:MAG: YggT family protein [Pseudomonadota bacterium]